jgi:N-acetylgalactosamine-6-sulfatase
LTNSDFSYLELYDIVADPYEKTNRKDDRPETAKQLLEKLDRWTKTLPAEPSPDLFSVERSRP